MIDAYACGGNKTGPLPIERLGAPALRRFAEPIAEVDATVRRLALRMLRTMYAAGGQGLAAPQVGHSLRLAVVDVPPGRVRHVLVNPRIVGSAEERASGVEGCLSIPGVWATVERPASVVAQALDLDGCLRTLEAEGELARCLQHEIDHLDGILYIDRLSPLNRLITVAQYRRSTPGGVPVDGTAAPLPWSRREGCEP
jgi:peptide deformylase